jgi:hypothetical protein
LFFYPDPERFRERDARLLALDFNTFPSASRALIDLLARAVEPSSGSGLLVQVDSSYKPFLGKTYFGRWGRIRSSLVASLGFEYLFINKRDFCSDFPIKKVTEELLDIFQSAHDYSDIKKIKFNGGSIGYSVISTMATILGESEFTIHTRKKLLPRLIRHYTESYFLTKALIESHKIQGLLVFNGRFINENAAVAAAKNAGITVIYYERPRPETYIASCHSPHSITGFALELEESLKTTSREEVQITAKEWYEKRFNRLDPEIMQFQSGWSKTWPINLDDKEKNLISIFPTSDDEFFGISQDWDLPGNATQRDWVLDFAVKATSAGNSVVIRLHPNLLTKSKRLIKSWSSLEKIPGVHLIMPESPVDSYRLIKTSDLVVTCGSTIAMEAGYLGAPVLSIGSGIYDYLHAVKKITDPNQWDLILKNKDFHELKANIAACENYAFFEKKREIERLYDFEEYPGKISSLPNLFIRVVSYIYRYSQQKQKGFTLWMNH